MKKPLSPKNNDQLWKNSPKPWHDSGFYRTIDIESLDNRSTIGKSVHNLKTALREFIGTPSVVGELLISRITYKTIKLSLYKDQCLQDSQNIEAHHYLPIAEGTG